MRHVTLIALLTVIGIAMTPILRPRSIADAAGDPRGSTEPKPIDLPVCLIEAVKTARLASDRPGVVAEVAVQEGEMVRDGQIVVRLMDDVPKANYETAKLEAENKVEVEYARLANAVDKLDFEKQKRVNLRNPNTIAEMDLKRAELAADRSRLQIEKARHEIAVFKLKAKQAEAELSTYQIRAPFEGVVTRIDKHRGEAVRQGDTVLEMVNTDVVKVQGKVKKQDIWYVKPGAPVNVRLSLGEIDSPVEKKVVSPVEKKVFVGRIGYVSVISNTSHGETEVWAEVQNPDNFLRPGLTAWMTIFPRSTDVPTVKTSQLAAPARPSSFFSDGRSSNAP
jgi:membrane fusion protein, multidrug efflux system